MDIMATLQHVLGTLGFHQSVSDWIVLFGLIFARIVGAVSLTPFLGGRLVVSNVKVGLSVLIALLLFPSVVAQQVAPANPLVMIALVIKEVMIGMALGFITQIVLYAVQMAGALID